MNILKNTAIDWAREGKRVLFILLVLVIATMLMGAWNYGDKPSLNGNVFVLDCTKSGPSLHCEATIVPRSELKPMEQRGMAL